MRIGLDQLVDGSGEDDLATVVTAVGTEVDHPVRSRDNVEIVLDHDHSAALVDHAGQQPDEVRNIRRVQPGRRFIENKDR